MTGITRRAAGWLGVIFVVLLFLSAGMVTLPSPAQDPSAIAAFYSANRSVVLIAQAVGLIAVPVFIAFALGLEDAMTGQLMPDGVGAIGVTGILVGVASVGTSVPVIMLALTTAGLPLWVRTTDLSDAVLFLAIASFCAATGIRGVAAPAWLRAVGTVAGLFTLARSMAGFAGIASFLDVVAPLAFLVFVLAAGVYLLVTARDETA